MHKAALNGHMPIIQYLLPERADVHARDNDGWTALHNACSKVSLPRHPNSYSYANSQTTQQGYLDIVRWLCEHGGASSVVDGVRGVDARSKDGWTPLSTIFNSLWRFPTSKLHSECIFEGTFTCRSISAHEAICKPPYP